MVKVMVEWRAKPGKEHALEGMLKDIRSRALLQPGYISGETLVGVDQPSAYMVISTWTRLDAWNAWERSEERQMIVQLIAPNVIEESCTRIYKHLFEED